MASKVAQVGGAPVILAKNVGLGVAKNDRGRLLIFFSSPKNGVTATVGSRLHRDSDLNFQAQIGDKIQLRNGGRIIANVKLGKLVNEGQGIELASC